MDGCEERKMKNMRFVPLALQLQGVALGFKSVMPLVDVHHEFSASTNLFL